MLTSEFCYWLQGYFELSESNDLSQQQVEVIKAHLALVFLHDLDPKQIKDKLQKTHDSGNKNPTFGGVDNLGNVYRC